MPSFLPPVLDVLFHSTISLLLVSESISVSVAGLLQMLML